MVPLPPRSTLTETLFPDTTLFRSTRSGENRVKVTAKSIGEVDLAGAVDGDVALAVRPEKIFVSEEKPTDPDVIALRGKVGEVAYYGSFSNVFFDVVCATRSEARRGGKECVSTCTSRWSQET